MTIRYLIAVLFSVALIWLTPQATEANKQLNNKTHINKQVVSAAVTQAPTPDPPAQPVVDTPPPQPTTHEEMMAAAGIAVSDYPAVDYIVTHESGWNPDATEPTSGAHGLPQALPYDKTGCSWDDAVCQLAWANSYAVSRYGGWWGAYNYWVAYHNW